MIGDNLNTLPSFLQPNRPKQLTFEELRNERKRLEEIQRIAKLKMVQAETYKKQEQAYALERQQKIQALKQVGGGVVNVFKSSLEKVSEFDKSRMNAKPLIEKPQFPRKGIYR